MHLTVFLGIINLIKLSLIRFLPLLGDEAYYSYWARHLALSYTDHPPMIAYINWLIGPNELLIRLTAMLGLLITTWLIYLIGKEAFGKKIGVASAMLFNLIPTYFVGGLFLTPELPLLIFWLASMYFCLKIVKTKEKLYWYSLGIAIGLGLLSKFPMILFPAGLFLFLLISDQKKWFAKKEPYLAAVLGLIVFSPVIIWNIQHGFPSLLHHGARVGSPNYLNNILNFFVLQFLMYSPPLFIFTVTTILYGFWRNLKKLDNYSLLFISLSLPAFLAFLIVSPFTLVGGHWTSIAYLGLIIVLCQRWATTLVRPFHNARFWFYLTTIVLLDLLVVIYYAFLFPIPAELQGKAYTINQELNQYVEQAKVDHVFSNQMGVASLVAFYAKTEVHLPKGVWRQYDIWGRPELKPGDDVLYFAFAKKEKEIELRKVFHSVKLDPAKRLYTKDSDIPNRTQIFICRGYRGGQLP